MVTILDNKPSYLAAIIEGKIKKDDYDKLSPLIDQKVEAEGKLNCLFIVNHIDGMSAWALWEDMKLGIKHANHFRKIAVVGEEKWQQWLAKIGSPLTSAEVKVFDKDERAKAELWVKP